MASNGVSTKEPDEPYKLYHNYYSLCSLMVRYSLAMYKGSTNAPRIEERPIDIHLGEQLSEFYLCEVNPKGTVPVLVHSTNSAGGRITESMDITQYFSKYFPSLYPPDLVDDITALLADLHAINYFSLTYTHKPQRASDMENGVLALMADPGISERYQRALELKLEVVRRTRAPALDPTIVKVEEQKTTAFLSKVAAFLESSAAGDGAERSPWIFGTPEPTALDAHTVPFLARLLDVGRENMLGDRVKAYAEEVFETEAWKAVMQGRMTVARAYR